jgi:hypothetical protein
MRFEECDGMRVSLGKTLLKEVVAVAVVAAGAKQSSGN